MRDPRTSWICSSGPVSTGELFSGASVQRARGRPAGGERPPGRSAPGSAVRLRQLGGRGEGGVNEVMEATDQEVITLESNLPRIRAVAPGSAAAAAAGAGHGAAAKLGSRRGRVARFAPVAGEPGSERSCCPRRLPRCPAERPPLPAAGGAGRLAALALALASHFTQPPLPHGRRGPRRYPPKRARPPASSFPEQRPSNGPEATSRCRAGHRPGVSPPRLTAAVGRPGYCPSFPRGAGVSGYLA